MKSAIAILGLVFMIGLSVGYVLGLASARQSEDILDCIELEECPGLEEHPRGSSPAGVLWV